LPPFWPNQTLPSKNAGHGIHHPVYGVKMKDKADKLGVECHLLIRGVSESKKCKRRSNSAAQGGRKVRQLVDLRIHQ
jgi:hypothetical protein